MFCEFTAGYVQGVVGTKEEDRFGVREVACVRVYICVRICVRVWGSGISASACVRVHVCERTNRERYKKSIQSKGGGRSSGKPVVWIGSFYLL